VGSAVVASLIAALALGFFEGLGRFYPARDAWWRLRRARGRHNLRAMRERFEATAERGVPRRLALVLLALVVAWVAGASLLDKRWYEVVFDVLPYVIVMAALLRTPRVLRSIAERMKGYERQAGEDPDAELEEDDEGPSEIAL
jgi:hypothetical protein